MTVSAVSRYSWEDLETVCSGTLLIPAMNVEDPRGAGRWDVLEPADFAAPSARLGIE